MTTLGEEIDRVQAEMGRGSDDQVRQAIISAIAEHERELHHWSERRQAIIELTAGKTWYSTIGFRDPSIYTAAQIETIQSGDDQDLTWSFDDFPWTGDASRIIKVIYARLYETAAETQSYRMDEVSYQEFECLQEGTTNTSQPHTFTRFSHQIGVYPTPDASYPLRLSVWCKPFAPTADSHVSVFFDQAEHLIRAASKKNLCEAFQDWDGYAAFEAVERRMLSNLRAENARRRRGRIVHHGPC